MMDAELRQRTGTYPDRRDLRRPVHFEEQERPADRQDPDAGRALPAGKPPALHPDRQPGQGTQFLLNGSSLLPLFLWLLDFLPHRRLAVGREVGCGFVKCFFAVFSKKFLHNMQKHVRDAKKEDL